MNGISAISRSPHQHPLRRFFCSRLKFRGTRGREKREGGGNEKTFSFPFPPFTLYYCKRPRGLLIIVITLFDFLQRTVKAETRDNWGILGREKKQKVCPISKTSHSKVIKVLTSYL